MLTFESDAKLGTAAIIEKLGVSVYFRFTIYKTRLSDFN